MNETLQFTVQANRQVLPVLNQPQMLYLLLGITPPQQAERLPLNFAIVLDASASMKDETMDIVKDAVRRVIDLLAPEDYVTIIQFATNATVIIPSQPAQDKDRLKKHVADIQVGGGTQMGTGLRKALTELEKHASPERAARIILLTDGATSNERTAQALADKAGAAEIMIYGLGLGADYDEAFLQDITDRSLGTPRSGLGYHNYIRTVDEAGAIFQETFQVMQSSLRETTLTMRLVAELECRSVFQVYPQMVDLGSRPIQGRAVVIPVGDLPAGGVHYLVELLVPPRPAGLVRLVQADTSYTQPGAGFQRQPLDVIIEFSHDQQAVLRSNPNVVNIIQQVNAFRLQQDAMQSVSRGDTGNATRQLRQAVTILIGQGRTELADEMARQAENLEQGKELTSEGIKTIKVGGSKTVRLTDLDNQ
ncbi:MAG: VWA domain-containing protein [Anaerolineae bacterium]|nr:VWA domain-containing protein [Anaerolineae bacterium]